jgi:hypothetical protein
MGVIPTLGGLPARHVWVAIRLQEPWQMERMVIAVQVVSPTRTNKSNVEVVKKYNS